MKTVERQKFVLCLPPVSASGGAHASNTYVDTLGWSHVRFLICAGALGANVGSTASTTAPLVEESDVSGSSYTEVTGAQLSAVLTGTTDNGKMWSIDVDLTKDHKRYMRVQAPTAGAGACLLSIVGILSDKVSGAFGGGAAESGLAGKISA